MRADRSRKDLGIPRDWAVLGLIAIFMLASAASTVGSREWLSLPNDGFDFPLIITDSFRAGPVVNGRWERDVSSLERGFRHVGAINLSAEAGVFAEWWPAGFLRA